MRDEAGGRAPLGIRRRTYGLRNRGIPRFAILHSGSARPPFGSRPSPRSARRQRPFLAGVGPSSPSWSTGLVARPGSGGRPRGVGFGTPEGGRRTHRRIEWSDRLSRWWAGIPRTVGTASTCASPQRTIRIEPGLDHKGLRGLSTAASTNPRLERILASHTIADPSSRGNDGPGRNDVPVPGPALTRPGFARAFLEPSFEMARGPRLAGVWTRLRGRPWPIGPRGPSACRRAGAPAGTPGRPACGAPGIAGSSIRGGSPGRGYGP